MIQQGSTKSGSGLSIFLGDVPAATAILDRFLAHAEIVPMTGKSYRLRGRTKAEGEAA